MFVYNNNKCTGPKDLEETRFIVFHFYKLKAIYDLISMHNLK